MSLFRTSALAVAISSALGLAGCGGGGGSSSSTPPATPTEQTVSGNAVKGVLRNAIVTAWLLDDSGSRASQIATTRTDNEGAYSLPLGSGYRGDLIEIEVTPDGDTRMVCDASACGTASRGDLIELPAGFSLNTITEAPTSATTISAPVTAWSTLAARRAQALITDGSSPRAATRRANSEVSDLVGFDILTTRATGLSQISDASPAEGQSAVMNAAVAEILFGDTSSEDLAEKLSQFTTAFEDGIFGDAEDDYSLAQLATASQTVVSTTPDLDSLTRDAVNNKTTEYDASPDGYASNYDESLIVDDNASQDEKIAQFQTFVGQASGWFQSFEDLDSDQLGLAVNTDIETIQAIFDTTAQGQLQFIGDALDAAFVELLSDPAAAQLLLNNGGTRSFSLTNADDQSVAEINMTLSNDNGVVILLEGTITLADQTTSIPFNLELDTNIPASSLDLNTAVITALATSNTLGLSGVIGNADGSDGLVLDQMTIKLDLSAALSNSTGITETQLADAFSAATFDGAIEAYGMAGDSFKGEIGASLVRLNPGAAFNQSLNMGPYSLSRLRVAGDFSGANGNQFRTSATLNVNNATSFDTFAWLQYSNDRSGLTIPVAYNDFELLLTPENQDEEAFFSSTFLSQEESATGSTVYRLNVGGWRATGGPIFNSRGYFGDDLTNRLDEAQNYIASQFPPTVDMIYFDSEFQEQTFTLDVSQLFNGSRELRGFFIVSATNSFDMRVTLDSNLLPAGVSGAVAFGANDFEIGLSENPEGPGSIVRFDSLLSVGLENIVAILDVPTPEAATEYSFRLGDNLPDSSYTFLIESTPENFSTCEQNPPAFLAFPEATTFNCAETILEYSLNTNRTLDTDEVALIDNIIENALVQRFGSTLAGQLETVELFGYADDRTQTGSFDLTVEYPDLETTTRFLDSSLSVTSSVTLNELPTAQVTVTANRSSYRGGNLLANVRWDGGNYSIALNTSNAEDPTAYRGRIFNSQGYELTFRVGLNTSGDINSLAGDAILNGETIGQLQLRNSMPVIIYPNGSEDVINTLL